MQIGYVADRFFGGCRFVVQSFSIRPLVSLWKTFSNRRPRHVWCRISYIRQQRKVQEGASHERERASRRAWPLRKRERAREMQVCRIADSLRLCARYSENLPTVSGFVQPAAANLPQTCRKLAANSPHVCVATNLSFS